MSMLRREKSVRFLKIGNIKPQLAAAMFVELVKDDILPFKFVVADTFMEIIPILMKP